MERFVVGTGRCGSTLLSNMLAAHPGGLIISECMASLDRTRAFHPGLVSCDKLKDLLLYSIPIVDIYVRRGTVAREQKYQVEDHSNFRIPGLLYIMLPTLSNNPDALFAEMMEFVDSLPLQTMAEHFLMLFSWLQKKLGRTYWIERSGDSIEFMPDLLRMFPQAKFLHLHRDGPEATLSMFNHSYFQVMVSFFLNPPTREELEQTEYAGLPVHADDPISRRLSAGQPSLEQFAEYWNYQLEVGYSVFAKLDASQYLDVRFEDLIAAPASVLSRIADFFELPESPGWIEKAAAMADASEVRSNVSKMSSAQLQSLRKACQPGQILLGRYKHPWIYSTLELIREIGGANMTSLAR